MFFGPSIPQPAVITTPKKSPAVSQHASPARPKMEHRHSYSGSGTIHPWMNSPNRSAPALMDEDEEMFFTGPSSSFTFDPSLLSSPRSPPSGLPKKFKPRDSGVCLSTSDEEGLRFAVAGEELSADSRVPSASTSISTAASSGSEFAALVTPLFGPSHTSGWPAIHPPMGDDLNSAEGGLSAHVLRALHQPSKPSAGAPPVDVGAGKRAPGTPVKKVKTAFVTRPWQSAFMPGKVGLPFMDGGGGEPKENEKTKKKPRQSMPAVFPGAQTTVGKSKRMILTRTESIASTVDGESESDSENASPSAQRDVKYTGLGLGRPAGAVQRAKWLLRRSSSGQFESGSESTGSAGTPTKLAQKGTRSCSNTYSSTDGSPARMPVPAQFSPTGSLFKHLSGPGSRSGSASSTLTQATLNSPTTAKAGPGQGKSLPFPAPRPLRHRQSSVELFRSVENAPPPPFALTLAASSGPMASTPTMPAFVFPSSTGSSPLSPPRAPALARMRMSSMCDAEARPGWFEREFVEVDEIGSGEFGSVYRVRRKAGGSGEWAVKKSARFEGSRQRSVFTH
jgi:mitosis inhibitor protein kinase SWE1